MEYKHILVINYTLFNGMTTKLGEKKWKGSEKNKKQTSSTKERTLAFSIPPPTTFLFDQSYVNCAILTKYLKTKEKKWDEEV